MSEEKKLAIESEIQEALQINTDDIITELKEQPSLYYYYACGWALATRKRRLQKMKLNETEAKLGNEFKQLLKDDDPKVRVTERMLDDYLSENPTYQEAVNALIQSEYMESILEVAKDAFKERYGALIELSKSQKDEAIYGSEFAIMKTEMERRDEKVKRKRGRSKLETAKTE